MYRVSLIYGLILSFQELYCFSFLTSHLLYLCFDVLFSRAFYCLVWTKLAFKVLDRVSWIMFSCEMTGVEMFTSSFHHIWSLLFLNHGVNSKIRFFFFIYVAVRIVCLLLISSLTVFFSGTMLFCQDTQPNRILLVTIHNPLFPITVSVLHQVFSAYGFIEKIVTFQKSAGLLLSLTFGFNSMTFTFSTESFHHFY